MFLLNTVVISEFRKPSRRRNPSVVRWISGVSSQDLFVSVLTIGEIKRGIERERHADPAFSENLRAWLDLILLGYEERILPVNVAIARRWGRLSHQTGNKGLDLAIAATALEHGLTVATRNLSHFAPTGVAVIDPFEPHPRPLDRTGL